MHDATVLGGLATEQRAARLSTARGHAGDHLGDALGVDGADSDVVEEEEGLGTDAHEVVDAHGHQIDPDGVEAPSEARHLELGPHAIGGRDQHGVRVALGVEGEHPAEATDAAQDLGSGGGGDHVLDGLDGRVTCCDVDTGGGVGGTELRHGLRPPGAPAGARSSPPHAHRPTTRTRWCAA